MQNARFNAGHFYFSAISRGALVLSQDSNDTALYRHCGGGNDDGLHCGIRRLQAYFFALAIEALERGISSIDECDYDLAVVGCLRLLYQYVIAVHDVLVLHGLAT